MKRTLQTLACTAATIFDVTNAEWKKVDCSEMETLTNDAKFSISYFGESKGELWGLFSAFSNTFAQKFEFLHTPDADCAAKFGLTGPGVALFRKFDNSPIQYSGTNSFDAF